MGGGNTHRQNLAGRFIRWHRDGEITPHLSNNRSPWQQEKLSYRHQGLFNCFKKHNTFAVVVSIDL